MKKKQSTLLLTALLTLGSSVPAMATSVTDTATATPTFSYSNSTLPNFESFSNEKVSKELKERKEMLEETIYADSFKELSLGEKMVLVEGYFTVRSDIHKENQKTILSVTDILELHRIEGDLKKESDNESKDNALISALIQEVKTKDMSKLTADEIKNSKELMNKLIGSNKDLRTAGRDLDTLIHTQIKMFNSTQLRMLNKFGQESEINGDKEQALELNKKMLKLTEGDIQAYKKVTSLLSAQGKNFFFVDNEVIETTIPFFTKNGGAYIDISDMSKVTGFEITNEEKKLTVQNGDNKIEVNKEDSSASFNGTPIGKDFTVLDNGKLYLPIHSIFELFHYDVKWDGEIQKIVIYKQVYEKNELDSLSVEQFVDSLFPQVPVEKVEKKADKPSTDKQPTKEEKIQSKPQQ
ncbi:stalk domain-containing protein [Bacillus sp. M6-12]|uniref:stalk domain-containing protein n=1 Tax=Bacillus sp. M6-12 TaxID=2054166 RepID=UPI0015E1007E|nr:stalk domain-containing protein [Bacillus sp. M6-12]